MSDVEDKYTARNMITLHGLRAQAIVQERLEEARRSGDASGLNRWQNVAAAIGELRRTAPGKTIQA